MSKTYIISDLHLGHRGIHEKFRPQFSSEQEHDDFIISEWNSVVKKRDVVKVLGDFIMNLKSLHYLAQLNGTIHWTLGNHDPKITEEILRQNPNISYVDGVRSYKGAVLSHAPIHPQELEYRNWAINIHGHIHHAEKNNLGNKYFNVNADIMGFKPREFHSIMEEATRNLDGETSNISSTTEQGGV